jgi:small neutral amino acid transporter SnatA (MarC family)
MSLVVGGLISAILGFFGLIFWWSNFIALMKGIIPAIMLTGGIVAIYMGLNDIQDKIREEHQKQEENLLKAREEIELVKAQAEQYKEEIKKLKEVTKQKD